MLLRVSSVQREPGVAKAGKQSLSMNRESSLKEVKLLSRPRELV